MTPLELNGPAGRLEALLDEPAAARGVNAEGLVEASRSAGLRAAVVFAHPHPQFGGTVHTKVVYQSSKALTRIGCAVLRFNFRGVGRSEGEFDNAMGEQQDFRAAVDFMHQRYPDLPIWAAGMSFGSYVGLTDGAGDERVQILLGVAVPAGRYDFTAVRESTKPKFLIHGERDDVAPLKDVRRLYAELAEPKELVVIDGADHLFDGKVTEVAEAIEDLLGDYGGDSPS
jgi:alpha/beta superfamily hydrolase